MSERRALMAGNWKMNLSLDESVKLVQAICTALNDLQDVEVLVAPPYTSLGAVKRAIGNMRMLLGAQNMHWEKSGAYTGEISGKMLQEAGCTHVILGHSERRIHFHETSELVDLKIRAAISLGLVPIVCIGETLAEREGEKTFEVIEKQLTVSLQGLLGQGQMPPTTVLAYEPVWAIGTGRTATPDQAQEVHGFIRRWMEKSFGPATSNRVRILYGGSVKGENIKELMSEPDIDGALVGGASLKADSFTRIVRFREQ